MSHDTGMRVLADEIAAIRHTRGACFAYGTPFWGEFAGNSVSTPATLAMLVQPVKADRFTADALPSRDAFVPLLRTIINFSNDTATSDRLLGIAAQTLNQVPARRMEFRRTDRIWEGLACL